MVASALIVRRTRTLRVPRRPTAAGAVLASLCLAAAVSTTTNAEERLVRRFDHRDGLPVSAVFALGQDSSGFLWIGTAGGLVRSDGHEMRPWARESVTGLVDLLATGPRGQVLFRHEGRLFRVTPPGVEPLPVPAGLDPRVQHAAFDGRGDLWVVRGGRLERWVGGQGRPEAASPSFAGERVTRVHPGDGDVLLVTTERAIWSLAGGLSAHRVLNLDGVIDVLSHPGGSLFILRYAGPGSRPWQLLEWRDGRLSQRLASSSRAVDVVLRQGSVWASFVDELVVIPPGGSAHTLGGDYAWDRTGGPLLVDHEGSLWMANFVGLFHFPEPDTAFWTEDDGLPSRQVRFLTRTADGLWVSTWGGLVGLRYAPDRTEVSKVVPAARVTVCADAWGRLWTSATLGEGTMHRRTAFLERRDAVSTFHEYAADAASRCSVARDGTVWLSLGSDILRSRARGGRPVPVCSLAPDAGDVLTMLETREGRLWAGTERGLVCAAPIGTLGPGTPWTCDTLPGLPQVRRLAATPSGSVWAATSSGLFRRTRETWEEVPGSRDLPSPSTFWIRESPAGGLWVTGQGSVLRVAERPDLPAGWEVLERIGVWQGLPTAGAEGIWEDADGTVWLATAAGLVRVPPQARRAVPKPPRVRLVDVRVDGERLGLTDTADLPHDRNRLELDFAALTFRDRGLLRYRVRSSPDADWTEILSPSFRFVDVPPGTYRAEVIASLDGVHWSDEPAAFAFRIRAPWYRQTWMLAALAGLAALVLYGAYRMRLAVLLRLERQRTRIAMDLHDEMGSGLSSIGLLADLAREPHVSGQQRRTMLDRIGDTSADLAAALSDIVWSLRPGSASLESLAAQLADRGSRMFPDATVRFTTEFPEPWPATPMSLAVRRNVQRIAVEALHNAARHAGASRVTLGFACAERRWRMWIEDDGRGLQSSEARPGGLGLTSMRSRAAEIGADIRWTQPGGGGTRVEVLFEPTATARN